MLTWQAELIAETQDRALNRNSDYYDHTPADPLPN